MFKQRKCSSEKKDIFLIMATTHLKTVASLATQGWKLSSSNKEEHFPSN